MSELGFKQLTVHNWWQPDPVMDNFVRRQPEDGSTGPVSGEDWTRAVLAVRFTAHEPLEVRRLFDVARGALCYGFFFYPLLTLGAEQLSRVAEAAITHKCTQLGATPKEVGSFHKGLTYLIDHGAVPEARRDAWDAVHKLRNLASHPKDQAIFTPGIALDTLRGVATLVNALFAPLTERSHPDD